MKMPTKMFYNGFRILDENNNKKLILRFNNGKYEYMPKWEDLVEILSEVLYIENLNFGKNIYDTHYPPYVQDLIDVVSYYLWKNPKVMNRYKLKKLENAIKKLKELEQPKFKKNNSNLEV